MILPRIYGNGLVGQGEPVPPEALALFALIRNHPEQQRASMTLHPLLCRVAQEKAMDLGVRDYWSHTTPDGIGPNDALRQAGYVLPNYYHAHPGANNVESLAAGQLTPEIALDGWLRSKSHTPHILGVDFYNDQVNIGVGYASVEGSFYTRYWVCYSAPAEPSARSGRWQ
jgi:uncharacterized protein YkwD